MLAERTFRKHALDSIEFLVGASDHDEDIHLAAARAAGVHGWLAWSTRLCFLVAQTSVPGLWLAGRAVRLRVFLELAHGLSSSQPGAVVDATGLIAVTLVFQFLLIRTLLRGYGPRVRTYWRERRTAVGQPAA